MKLKFKLFFLLTFGICSINAMDKNLNFYLGNFDAESEAPALDAADPLSTQLTTMQGAKASSNTASTTILKPIAQQTRQMVRTTSTTNLHALRVPTSKKIVTPDYKANRETIDRQNEVTVDLLGAAQMAEAQLMNASLNHRESIIKFHFYLFIKAIQRYRTVEINMAQRTINQMIDELKKMKPSMPMTLHEGYAYVSTKLHQKYPQYSDVVSEDFRNHVSPAIVAITENYFDEIPDSQLLDEQIKLAHPRIEQGILNKKILASKEAAEAASSVAPKLTLAIVQTQSKPTAPQSTPCAKKQLSMPNCSLLTKQQMQKIAKLILARGNEILDPLAFAFANALPDNKYSYDQRLNELCHPYTLSDLFYEEKFIDRLVLLLDEIKIRDRSLAKIAYELSELLAMYI